MLASPTILSDLLLPHFLCDFFYEYIMANTNAKWQQATHHLTTIAQQEPYQKQNKNSLLPKNIGDISGESRENGPSIEK